MLSAFFKVPFVSSQGITLITADVAGDLSVTDPSSDLWQKATAIEVPLSAQNVTPPHAPQRPKSNPLTRAPCTTERKLRFWLSGPMRQ